VRQPPIDRFDPLVDRPIAWQETAAHYIAAANYLLDADEPAAGFSVRSVGTNWPAMLLYATAAENLLKAIRIAQGESVVANGKLAPYFSSHDLPKYADDAGLSLPKAQRSLAGRLQHVLEAGKYPVAKGPGRSARAWTWERPDDVRAVWKLLQTLDDALRATGTECLDKFDVDKLEYARASGTAER
jgi:hypothetical protein